MKKAGLILSVLALSACSKVTQENYDKLELGMDSEKVSEILGAPAECSENLATKTCLWGQEQGSYIQVSFVGNKAAIFNKNELK